MSKKSKLTSSTYISVTESKKRVEFQKIFNNWPGNDDFKMKNLGLFINRILLMRILFMNELYQKTLDITGDVIEFGCRWGQNLSLFMNFRGIYEPYNLQKKIIGFDTFSGFPSVSKHEKKGNKKISTVGSFSTTKLYEDVLSKILEYHAFESPADHIKRHDLVKGDASKTIKNYLKKNSQTLIALAYFDMDIYKPTKDCLKAIIPYLTKGSIIGFDEPNSKDFPGETLAIKEVFGNLNFKMMQSKFSAGSGYIIIE